MRLLNTLVGLALVTSMTSGCARGRKGGGNTPDGSASSQDGSVTTQGDASRSGFDANVVNVDGEVVDDVDGATQGDASSGGSRDGGVAMDARVSTDGAMTGTDTCSAALPSNNAVGDAVFTGTTTGAGNHRFAQSTGEDDCPSSDSGGEDVTVRWVAPRAGTFVFDTQGSSFDTQLYLITSCSGDPIACNDDIDLESDNYQSSVTKTFSAGESIFVVVDGYDEETSGDFVINVTQAGAGADGGVRDGSVRDSGADASVLTPGQALTNYDEASDGISLELCGCNYAAYGYLSADECVAANRTPTEISLCQQDAAEDASLRIAEYYSCLTAVSDDYLACVQEMTCDSDHEGDCSYAAYLAQDECPSYDPESSSYDADLATDYDAYYAALTACAVTDVVGDGPDMCSLMMAASSSVGARVFDGTTIGAGNHRFAEGSDDDDCPFSDLGGADVIKRWTAPFAGTFTFDTVGSSFDTQLYILDACDGTPLVCNDDIDYYGGITRSRVTRSFSLGETVFVVVDGYSPVAAGTFVINVTGE